MLIRKAILKAETKRKLRSFALVAEPLLEPLSAARLEAAKVQGLALSPEPHWVQVQPIFKAQTRLSLIAAQKF